MQYLTQELALIARIKPQTITAAATANSDAISMEKMNRVLFIFNMGDYAAGNDGAVTVKVTGGTDGSTFGTDLTGKSLTAASFTGSALDDSIALIHVTPEECMAQSVTYIRLEITPANQNLTCSAAVLAQTQYGPANEYDLAAVKEIIT